MCLTIKKGMRAKVAGRAIRVYKALVSVRGHTGLAPFQNTFKYTKGTTAKSRMVVRDSRWVDEGLHSFASRYGAGLKGYFVGRVSVVTMYIPKGARYIKGKFSGSVSYASNRLEWR